MEDVGKLIDQARKLGFGREDLPDEETRFLLLDMADALLALSTKSSPPAKD